LIYGGLNWLYDWQCRVSSRLNRRDTIKYNKAERLWQNLFEASKDCEKKDQTLAARRPGCYFEANGVTDPDKRLEAGELQCD